MAIETDFSFAQAIPRDIPLEGFQLVDLLGLLRPMVGRSANREQNAKRRWKGHGFNLIWRPNFGGEFGPREFFLQLNLTDEELDFTDITGTGIFNRSSFEHTIPLGGIAYTQAIKDSFDGTGQHFEPGVWANVPRTENPKELPTIVRMGSIPHGTTVNLQGTAFPVAKPVFDPVSIAPFIIGCPDDGKTGLVSHPDEEDFNKDSPSRTERKRLPTLTAAHLRNPNLFLSDVLATQTVLNATALKLTSDTSPTGSIPDVGGGTRNIASLNGKGSRLAGGPNASAPVVTATFWIEQVRDKHGAEFAQLQYTQRVLLNFNGLSWPHVTVATLTPI
jgi:hypothetical protein